MARRKKKQNEGVPEEPSDYAQETDVSRFDNMKILVYSGIFVVFGVAISANDFKSMWVFPAPGSTWLFIARIILFVELGVLAIRFVVATHHEWKMWLRWLKNPIEKQEVYAAIFAIAVVLGLSLAFAYKAVFITGFITVSFLLLYWAQWLANDHFDRALRKTKETYLSQSKRKALDAMEYYWGKRPQLARLTTMMFFSSVAFSLALAGAVQPEPQKDRFQLAAYAVLTLDIFIGEAVIAWWRHKLEEGLSHASASGSQS